MGTWEVPLIILSFVMMFISGFLMVWCGLQELEDWREMMHEANELGENPLVEPCNCGSLYGSVRLLCKAWFYCSASLLTVAMAFHDITMFYWLGVPIACLCDHWITLWDFIRTYRARAKANYDVNCEDVYIDYLGTRETKAFMIFIGQAVLGMMYAVSLISSIASGIIQTEPKENWLYFAAGIIGVQGVCFVASSRTDASGGAFRVEGWVRVIRAAMEKKPQTWFVQKDKDIDANLLLRASVADGALVWLILRFLGSFLVNGVLRTFIIVTTPIFLMTSKRPMDFVKDAVAIAFIPTLDNYPTIKTFGIADFSISKSMLGEHPSALMHMQPSVRSMQPVPEYGPVQTNENGYSLIPPQFMQPVPPQPPAVQFPSPQPVQRRSPPTPPSSMMPGLASSGPGI